MPEIAEDEPLPLGDLARYHHAGVGLGRSQQR
jgi:hypothetical protein